MIFCLLAVLATAKTGLKTTLSISKGRSPACPENSRERRTFFETRQTSPSFERSSCPFKTETRLHLIKHLNVCLLSPVSGSGFATFRSTRPQNTTQFSRHVNISHLFFPFDDQLTDLIQRSTILDVKSQQRAHRLWKSLVQNTAIQRADSASHGGIIQAPFVGAFCRSVGCLRVYVHICGRAEAAGGLCQCQLVETMETC